MRHSPLGLKVALAAVAGALPLALTLALVAPSEAASSWQTAGTVELSGRPTRVTVDSTARLAYVTISGHDVVDVVDTTTNLKVRSINVGDGPRSVALDAPAHRAYVTNYFDGTVSVIDTGANAVVDTLTLGGRPDGVVVDPSTHKVLFTNNTNQVTVLDTTTGQTSSTTVPGGGNGAYGIAVDATLHRAVVALTYVRSVSVLSTQTGELLTTLSAGTYPFQVAVDPVLHRAYASDIGAANMPAIDLTNLTVMGSAPVDSNSVGVGIDSTRSLLLAGNSGRGRVDVIDETYVLGGQVGRVVATVATPYPDSVAVDTSSHVVYSASYAGLTVITPPATSTPQSITFTSTPPASPRIGETYAVAATGGASGNPVTFGSGTPGTCTVGTDGEVTFTAAGDCRITADQAGDTDHAAAPQVTQTVRVRGQAQTIVFSSKAPKRPVVGSSYPVRATGGGSGNPVTFTIDRAESGDGACTVGSSTVSDGVSSAAVTLTGAGSCVVAADQAGSSGFEAAPQARQLFRRSKLAQLVKITSKKQSRYGYGTTYVLAATGGGSGNPVRFTSHTLDACTVGSVAQNGGVSSATVTFVGLGTCEVRADQAGAGEYDVAPAVSFPVTVSKAAQTITFTSPAPKPASPGATYQVSATGGGSGNPVGFYVDPLSDGACTFVDGAGAPVATSETATVTAPTTRVRFTAPGGRCVVTAKQGGSALYDEALPVSQTVKIAKR